jgi:hypothetical protein
VIGVPGHPARLGVTVIVPLIGDPVAFVAENPGTLPDPLPTNPIAGLELVHAIAAPAGVLVNAWAAIAVPAQTEILAGAVMLGTGFTVTVPVAVPTHPERV